MKRWVIFVAAMLVCGGVAWGAMPKGDVMEVKEQIRKFAPVRIEVDPKIMPPKQRALVRELVRAARYMDQIFLRQVYSGNDELLKDLRRAGKKGAPLKEYFDISFGPYDRLNHNMPFIYGVSPKRAGANFYPEDMAKKEFLRWVKQHPAQRQSFESEFTVISRRGKKLVAVPYSVEYGDLLEPAAGHLRKAAGLTDNPSLKKYLLSRALAFHTNDYFRSDVDWVRLKDHAIEVVIGPYEVYEDNLFGYKAAFEAFITRVDPAESKRLAKAISYMDDLEQHLPIADKYKGRGRSLSSPIVVAQVIYTAGDAKAGVQTLAFNLPNDERVRKQEGSKKVLLKNVQQAKFDKILKPIAKLVMRSQDVDNVDFEAFFAHTLLHEVSHGIGPGEIKKGRRRTTVNKQLKDLYSVIEECKADTLSAYNTVFLIDKGLYPKKFMKVLWPTYLAGIFRSVRFGINEAHGGSNAIQFNYLMDRGGFTYDVKTGLFGINEKRVEKALRDLAREVLMIEAKGDYKAAKKFVARYRTIRPEMKEALARLDAVPVDIKPIYTYK